MSFELFFRILDALVQYLLGECLVDFWQIISSQSFLNDLQCGISFFQILLFLENTGKLLFQICDYGVLPFLGWELGNAQFL